MLWVARLAWFLHQNCRSGELPVKRWTRPNKNKVGCPTWGFNRSFHVFFSIPLTFSLHHWIHPHWFHSCFTLLSSIHSFLNYNYLRNSDQKFSIQIYPLMSISLCSDLFSSSKCLNIFQSSNIFQKFLRWCVYFLIYFERNIENTNNWQSNYNCKYFFLFNFSIFLHIIWKW